ncbi:Sugar lactone lactonase YvrE [Variovorax sp. PDC80]|uniref:YncE family protein n=1 Tax=Variovorax sp. PDC80 TaxID=1882827 RepID=UPI0008E142A3|nr:hypothetical protein [Variovorax sp. PDC80]SFO64198.1 Sugar lactone lactonase YvrE [Variovorax sp. PDC80]
MKLKFTAIVGFCLALAACGGGGGGGGGGGFPGFVGGVPGATGQPETPASNPVITFSPSTLTGNQQTGTSASYVVKVNVTNPDVFTGPVYAVVLDREQILRQADGLRLVAIDKVTFAATLNTSGSLTPGRHRGTFSVSLCKDTACIGQYAGSPVSLPYDLTVTPKPLSALAPTGTRATVHVGAANPPEVDVHVGGPDGTWKATTSSSWLKVAQAEGQLPATLKARFVTQGMTAGIYQDELVVRSADGQEAKVGFTLEMLATQFQVSTDSFTFTGVNGATIPPQTLNFELDNGTPASWTASAASPWLLLQPGTGTTPGSLTARVDASKSNLASGDYTSSIVLASAGYPSKTVGTALTLTKPTLSAPSMAVILGGAKGRDEVAQSLSMSLNTGTNKWPWTLSTPLPNWVNAAATSGSVDANGTPLSFSPIFNGITPGTHSGLATVTAKVNGDTVTLPVSLVLNRDQRQLLPSEWGIGFASVPDGSVLTRTVRVTDNFGGALPWTATSSAPWLSVTGNGTTGTSPGLVLTADPKLAPTGQTSYATVTLKTSNPDVAAAVINVGLWKATSGLTALTTLPAEYTNIVADKIRPYVYAHSGGTSIDIYNAHLGTKVGSIANVGGSLAEMTVAPDGSKLYAVDTGGQAIAVVDLATASKIEAWPLISSADPYLSLLAIRTNGKNIVIAGDGNAYVDGLSINTLSPGGIRLVLAASSDGRRVFAQDTGFSPAGFIAFDVDYSAMGGGTLLVTNTASGAVNGAANGQDIAVNADGTALYTASGAPYRCSSVNPISLAFIASLPGGEAYPNNVKVTRDGRVICGVDGGLANADVWVHSANGTLLKFFKFGGLLRRQLAVTPDGMTAVGLTSLPQMVFAPLGAP